MSLEKHKEEMKNVRETLTETAEADNVISHQLQKLDNREGKASHVYHVIECFCLTLYLIAKFDHWFSSLLTKCNTDMLSLNWQVSKKF